MERRCSEGWVAEGLASVRKLGMMEGYRGGTLGTVSVDYNQDFEVCPKNSRDKKFLPMPIIMWTPMH